MRRKGEAGHGVRPREHIGAAAATGLTGNVPPEEPVLGLPASTFAQFEAHGPRLNIQSRFAQRTASGTINQCRSPATIVGRDAIQEMSGGGGYLARFNLSWL